MQDVVLPLIHRDCGDLRIGRREEDAAAGEREQRLQQIAIAIGGEAFDAVEKTRLRHRRVAQKRNRELADPEIPRRMPRPLDVEIVAVPERQLNALALELVGDDAVVDAFDLCRLAVAAVIEAAPLAVHLRHVDRSRAPHLFGDHEIRPRLLPARLDLHQHHFGGIPIAGDRVGHQRVITVGVEAVEIDIQRRRQAERVAICLGDRELKPVERREGLQLDELRVDRSVGVADEAEINLQECRQRFGAGALEAIGHGCIGGGHRVRVVEDLVDQLESGRGQRRHQGLRKEAGRLADREAERCPCAQLQPPDEVLVLGLSPRVVERSS